MIFKIDDHLELRPITIEDIPKIELLCTPTVMKMMNKTFVCPAKLAKKIEDSLIPKEFSIFQDDELIGGYIFGHLPDEQHILEIGYWLAESSHNKGIMSICLPAFIQKVVIDWYIQTIGHVEIQRVQAHTLAENIPSLKLLLKSGFTNQILLKDSFYKDGKFHDQFLLGLRVKTQSNPLRLQIKVTDSVYLRRLIKDDCHSLQHSISHPEVLEFTRMPMNYTMEMASSWITSNSSPSTTNLAIVTLQNNTERVIGMIGIIPKSGSKRYNVEIGYWLTTEFSGAGLMTRVVSEFLSSFVNDFYIHTLGKFVKRIHASVRSDNFGSQRVLEKNGFKVEGVIEAGVLKNGKIYDELVYAKIIE